MKTHIYFFLLVILLTKAQAQNVTITPNGITPVLSGNYPRISYGAILALPSPQQGDIAFDTTNKCLRVYVDGKWVCTYQNPENYPNAVTVASAGGTGDEGGEAMVTDTSGNMYITGSFFGLATFGTVNRTSRGDHDMFVAKYNKNGVLQWVQAAGSLIDDAGQSVAVDNSGNVYVIGYYQEEAKFTNSVSITSQGGVDIFLAKYNSNGVFQWVRSAGGTGNENGAGIALGASGNIYITGSYEGTATFDGISKTANGSNSDLFIAMYNNSGAVQWVQSAGGIGIDNGQSIAVDGSEKVYISGYFTTTTTFGTINKTSTGGIDIFIAKFDPALSSWSYVQTYGGTQDDIPQSIALDAGGNIYITGIFSGTTSFGGITKTSQGNNDIFVAKFNNTGVVQWVQSAGSSGLDSSQDIAVDDGGNVYLTGYYGRTATFGTITKTEEGGFDIFVAKYNNAGNLLWVKSMGNSNFDIGQAIAIDNTNNVWVTGRYSDAVIFDKTIKVSMGGTDLFLIKLDK